MIFSWICRSLLDEAWKLLWINTSWKLRPRNYSYNGGSKLFRKMAKSCSVMKIEILSLIILQVNSFSKILARNFVCFLFPVWLGVCLYRFLVLYGQSQPACVHTTKVTSFLIPFPDLISYPSGLDLLSLCLKSARTVW